ncbi:hypothetical protein QVD17_10807 [Tagetes erecta]|uniref:Uncharacterized protein n=1 Tax=Tagetes erecta TaxID=13708 RepID=A0AAD8L1W3_TARER|nr:hypothetical protein QVD17_10807 [Tagetes erecta]
MLTRLMLLPETNWGKRSVVVDVKDGVEIIIAIIIIVINNKTLRQELQGLQGKPWHDAIQNFIVSYKALKNMINDAGLSWEELWMNDNDVAKIRPVLNKEALQKLAGHPLSDTCGIPVGSKRKHSADADSMHVPLLIEGSSTSKKRKSSLVDLQEYEANIKPQPKTKTLTYQSLSSSLLPCRR